MRELYLSKANYVSFLSGLLSHFTVYAPLQKENFLSFERLDKEKIEKAVIDTRRAIQPLKSFFIPPHRKVGEYFTSSPAPHQEEQIILGAKSCDLKALKITDSVYAGEEFGKEYKDPFYINSREKTILISSDCLSPDEFCFCNLLEEKPFPEEGFDLNFSTVDEGFLVQVGSEKGKRLIEENQSLFSPADEHMIQKRGKNREKTIKKLEKINREFKTKLPYRQLIKESYDSPVWKDHSSSCVDCAGCNQICPTCRCFILADVRGKEKYERYYLWDGCLLTGFSRVAGGANPRPYLYQRFSNRLFCKFYFFPENINLDACTGCGRCIAVCIGKIDMRKVLRDLAIEKKIPVGSKNE
ncbi:4Fe-4S dicluster domain-containing protein [Candidatus Aerophobetes bacterium]|nr:4Fe-4S dicluster domain-containing protein [Candidatus Aerophobetes bacterium]